MVITRFLGPKSKFNPLMHWLIYLNNELRYDKANLRLK